MRVLQWNLSTSEGKSVILAESRWNFTIDIAQHPPRWTVLLCALTVMMVHKTNISTWKTTTTSGELVASGPCVVSLPRQGRSTVSIISLFGQIDKNSNLIGLKNGWQVRSLTVITSLSLDGNVCRGWMTCSTIRPKTWCSEQSQMIPYWKISWKRKRLGNFCPPQQPWVVWLMIL